MPIQLTTGAFSRGVSSRGATFTESVLLADDATVWDDLVTPLTTSRQGALSKPDFDYTNCGYLFPQNDTTEILYLNVQLPHRWKLGSGIWPHVHWHQAANQTPVFAIDYRWVNIGEAVSGSWSTYTMGTLISAYVSGTIHQINAGTAILAGTGKTMSSILQIKLYRNDNVYSGDALATSFDIHYESDTLGSNTEYTK